MKPLHIGLGLLALFMFSRRAGATGAGWSDVTTNASTGQGMNSPIPGWVSASANQNGTWKLVSSNISYKTAGALLAQFALDGRIGRMKTHDGSGGPTGTWDVFLWMVPA